MQICRLFRKNIVCFEDNFSKWETSFFVYSFVFTSLFNVHIPYIYQCLPLIVTLLMADTLIEKMKWIIIIVVIFLFFSWENTGDGAIIVHMSSLIAIYRVHIAYIRTKMARPSFDPGTRSMLSGPAVTYNFLCLFILTCRQCRRRFGGSDLNCDINLSESWVQALT
jgi:hypothetical protein